MLSIHVRNVLRLTSWCFNFLRPGEITTHRLGIIGHGVELAFSR
jgi:hypothetical protein